ncbi:MAG: hypothetical protein CBC00_02745 [Verrucomicrobia bacterium TMED40]|nr:MAG: hypothetical protein CBC00_02745 [Verrucomicrobia bacterium TMED40]|tara:strand:+ start:849 stop:1031 length:183 start_codon:yes stop_codon:yes gene_type:complete
MCLGFEVSSFFDQQIVWIYEAWGARFFCRIKSDIGEPFAFVSLSMNETQVPEVRQGLSDL